jgi:hypothetical protein
MLKRQDIGLVCVTLTWMCMFAQEPALETNLMMCFLVLVMAIILAFE